MVTVAENNPEKLFSFGKEIQYSFAESQIFDLQDWNLRMAYCICTIQTTIKTLIEKQIVTESLGTNQVYDKFFSIWLNRTL